MRFCCPGCAQAYYGTSPEGHLEPRGFACEKCSCALHMDDMVIEPEPGREDDAMGTRPVPWEDKPSGGFFKRLWLTATAGMIKPASLLADNREANAGPATGYYLALTGLATLAAAVTAGIFLMFMLVMIGSGGGGGGQSAGAFAGMMVGMTFCQVIATFIMWQVVLLVWTCCAHLILKFSGVKAGGFGRTWTALAYASGPLLISAVPLCGPYLSTPAGIWWMVSAVFTTKSFQRVSTGRAVAAVVVPPVALTFAVVAAYLALFFAAFGGVLGTAMSAAQQATGQDRTQTVGAALLASVERDGAWPAHASQLLLDGAITTQDFISATSGVASWQSTIGGHTLISFESLPFSQQSQAVEAEAAGMSSVSQYRLGDLVFCYAALDPSAHDPALWILVSAPLDGGHWAGEAKYAYACRLDGAVVEIDREDMESEVDAQNALRTEAGLPPLDDPFSVSSAMPVRRLLPVDEPEADGP